MVRRSFVKINLLFRIMDPLKRKSPFQSIERLQRQLAEGPASQTAVSSDGLEKQKLEIEQNMFTLLCYRAESVSYLYQFSEILLTYSIIHISQAFKI